MAHPMPASAQCALTRPSQQARSDALEVGVDTSKLRDELREQLGDDIVCVTAGGGVDDPGGDIPQPWHGHTDATHRPLGAARARPLHQLPPDGVLDDAGTNPIEEQIPELPEVDRAGWQPQTDGPPVDRQRRWP